MEGQGFNPIPGAAPTPTPEPAPAPGPESAPEMTFVSGPTEEVATEPIPQDSFAQPTVSSGASWQPTQATAPGVGNMNTAPMGPVPEPKKGGSGMIIAIIAAAVILIGLIVAIIVVIASGNNGGSNTSTTKTGTSGKDSGGGGSGSGSGTGNNTEDFQRAQRNTQREDDVARLLTAINDYQTNNNGKTPFGSGYYDKTTITNFVVRYIDADIDRDGVAEGKSFVCKKSSCPQFTDPDGTVYGFTVDLAKSGKRNEKIAYSGNVDHLFHVYVTAGCGEDSDTYTTGTGNRQIAVFYIEEGGDIVCNDNH